MGKILIEGMRIYAFHGCLEEEAKIGGNYRVDVAIETDFEKAAVTDDLNETIDYVTVYNLVKKEMAIRSKLIEHVGKRIQNALMETFGAIDGLEVKVVKIAPPMNGDVRQVSVVLNSKRISSI
jgi:dihydroneopterin aldolase